MSDTVNETAAKREYQERQANGTLPTGANLRALEEWAGLKSPPYWYRGKGGAARTITFDIVPEDQWCPDCSECRCDWLIIDDSGEHVHCSRCGQDYEL